MHSGQYQQQNFDPSNLQTSFGYSQSYFCSQPQYYMPQGPHQAALQVYPQQALFYTPNTQGFNQYSQTMAQYHPAYYGMPLFGGQYYPQQYTPQIVPVQQPQQQREIYTNLQVECTPRFSMRSTQEVTSTKLSTVSTSHDQSNITQEAQKTYTQIETSPKCKVVLQVACNTNLNQKVAVVGSVSALGSWEVSKALIMSTERDTYPNWTVQFSADDTVPQIEFKFVKLTSHSDSQMDVEWEDIQANRVLDLHQKASIVVEYGFSQQEKRKETFVNKVQKLNLEPVNLELYNQSRSSPLTLPSYNATPNTEKAEGSPPENFLMLSKTQDIKVKDFSESLYGGKSQPALSVDSHNRDHFCNDYDDQKHNCRHCNRKLLKQELQIAFPQNFNDIKNEKAKKIKSKRRGEEESDSTSNESNTLYGSHVQSQGGPRKSNILITKNINPKTVQLDPRECIVQVSHQLPYRLVSRGEGQFSVEPSYPSPSLLYANLDELAQNKTYNFVWVGIVVMKQKMTVFEEQQANKILEEKNCFPIFFTQQQIIPYLSFYEDVIRPNMHNFADTMDHLKQSFNYWTEFKSINSKIARRVQDVRRLVNSHTIWIHGDQNMLVPYYIRQSEKVKASIGFYFHQAFPASAVFQSFFKREELLQSLLHSDLIGFHIWEYARNFINSCQRLLGLYYELGVGNTLSVFYNKRSIQIRIWHIGLDESFVAKIMAGQQYELARLKVINTVRNAVAREQNIRASISRGNLNSLHNNMHSASLPVLIGSGLTSTRKANSITSTLASSRISYESSVDTTQGKIILASIDSFHQLTGLILKLEGFYNFLKSFPEYRDKVVLFQVIRGLFSKSENMKGQHKEEEKKQNSRAVKNDKQGTFWLFEEVESLQALNQSVIKMVNKIRGEFGRSCLIVEQGNWTVDMRLALWSKANVLFVSTLKDGLYLTCFEYIHVKYLCKDFENSAMILSEFTGCSTQFAGFYDFNPFQVKTTVAALEKCLKDSPQEKAERMKRAFQFCHPRTFRSWVENFLKELKLACDPHTVEFTRIMYQGLQAVQYGKASRDIDCKLNFEAPLLPVQMDIKRQALVSVSRRKNLIMIDHEALPLKQLGRSEMFPRQQIILWIQEILYDKSNIVVIMSDKDRNYISSVFEQTLMQQENFWVAAESGYWLMTNKKQWIKLFEIQSKQWMHRIRSIMEEYCENIEGTLVEERSCTVIWNYKNAEEEYGSKSANILAEQIQHMLGQNSPIEIVRGNGFIEVLPKKLTKKAVLKHILSNLQLYCNQQIESFLFIGAEISDDSHQYLRNFIDKNIQQSGSQIRLAVDSRNRPLFAADCDYALCVLGNRPSIAQFYLEQRDVQYLLQEMAFKTQSRKRTKSVANLLDKSKNFESQENLYDSEEKELTQKISPKGLLTPPKKNLLKGRNLSQKNILRPISMPTRWMPPGIADHLENETIIETNEEDDTTQMSEFKQAEQDAHGISADLNDGNFNLRHNSEASLNYMRERISDNLGVGFRDLPKEFSRERKISGHAFDPSYQHSRTLFLNQQMEPRRHGTSSLQSFNEYEPNSSDLVVHQQVKLAEVSQTHESTSMPQLYRRSKKEVSPLTGNSELKMNDQMNLSSEDLAQHSKSSSFLNSGERWSESLPEEMFNKQDYSKSNSIFKERQSFFEYDQPDTPRLTPSDKKMKD